MNKVVRTLKGVGMKVEGAALIAVKIAVQLPAKVVGAAACAVSELTDEAVNAWSCSHSLRELKHELTDDELVEFMNWYMRRNVKES